MAIYFLNMKSFGRSGGSSAVSAAAYRAGERLYDERTGRTYDHRERQGVLHTEILLPSHLDRSELQWTQDRSYLWNAAERAETRKNSRVAREYLVALPAEMDDAQRLQLARGFSQELADRYKFALDLAVHSARDYPGSDPRNFHAHLLATTREVTAGGFTSKTTAELGDAKRHQLGLKPAIHELLHVRERWASVTNDALRAAHIEARIDHRTLAAQGIDREPYPHIPRGAFEMERHGYQSEHAERLRADYAARVQARLERQSQQERSSMRDQDTAAARDAPRQESRPQSLDEVRRQAREDWLKMRQEALKQPAPASSQRDHGRDDDHSL
jgi:hypothetical protein